MKLSEMRNDRKLFRQLRRVLTRAERLWLLDCDGDYIKYRKRLHILARDYKIQITEEAKD